MAYYNSGDSKYPVPVDYATTAAIPSSSAAAATGSLRPNKRTNSSLYAAGPPSAVEPKRTRLPYRFGNLIGDKYLFPQVTAYLDQCKAATKDGQTCGRAWFYKPADKKNAAMQVGLNCSRYCTEPDRCNLWMTQVLKFPPTFIDFWTTNPNGQKVLAKRRKFATDFVISTETDVGRQTFVYFPIHRRWNQTFFSFESQTSSDALPEPQQTAIILCGFLAAGRTLKFRWRHPITDDNPADEPTWSIIRNDPTVSFAFYVTGQPDNVWIRPYSRWTTTIDDQFATVETDLQVSFGPSVVLKNAAPVVNPPPLTAAEQTTVQEKWNREKRKPLDDAYAAKRLTNETKQAMTSIRPPPNRPNFRGSRRRPLGRRIRFDSSSAAADAAVPMPIAERIDMTDDDRPVSATSIPPIPLPADDYTVLRLSPRTQASVTKPNQGGMSARFPIWTTSYF